MKQFIAFVIKETKHILRDKRTMLILFGMPVVMMLLFGFAITTDVKNVRTVVVTSEMSPRTQQAVERLAQSEYFIITQTVNTPQEAERLIRSQKADMSLTPSPSPKGEGSSNLQWQIMVDGSDPNMAQQWTTYAQSILSQPIDGKHYSLPSPFGEGLGVRLLYNPQMRSAYNFVPAIMGMLLMLICAMMTSISIVREKEKGTMEVLLVSPVRPLMVIIAKAVPYLVLAFGILITILLMARFVLGVPLAGSLFWILAVSTLYILLALSLGLLISNVAQTQLVALLLSAMVLLMPVVMLSGMLFPVESMPTILQWISAIVPPRYYIEAMRKLMIMGVGIGEVVHEVAVLAGMTVVLLAIALKKFNVRLE
ncbi:MULTISPECIES: ABC transporter permease [Segatella]|uniref:Transport permease protein n=2 Tax=Segatella TaxID=2974251 RepID=D8DX63_9BACT|nr:MULTISPECIES: ABC transporter permease [Segatella]EFI71983.1 putative ABC transporter, permease protein [Segatella baroniae B14]UKK78881.1 ABC transporter permease [Segatella baroniae B14]GJG26863.1 transport permease protein [Segatella bryantii]SEQ43655.1 ABC-2 type transport system permease protein [Segatella baroniae B14]